MQNATWNAVKTKACLFIVMHICAILANAADVPGPQMLIDGGNSTGPVTALAFSPDSELLYVAGLDKCVQVWHLTALNDGAFEANRVQQLHWEINRHRRGEIAALAVSPTDGTVAIAGRCTRTSNGDIVLLDPGNGLYRGVLPPERSQGVNNGHRTTVQALSFSPSGEKLVSISEDRELRIWDLKTATSRVLRPAIEQGRYPLFQSAVFLSENKIAYTSPSPQGATQSVISVVTLDGKNSPVLNTEGSTWNAPTSNAGELLAGTTGGVLGWRDPENAYNFIHQFRGTVTSIAPWKDRIALAGLQMQSLHPMAMILDRKTKSQTSLTLDWDTSAPLSRCLCEVSPDGRWLVIATNASPEIKVWRLAKTGTAPVAGPLRLRSRILAPDRLSFSDRNGDLMLRIGFNDERMEGDVSIDLASGFFYSPAAKRSWVASEADGYSIVRDDNFDRQLGIRYAKKLSIQRQGRKLCEVTLSDKQSTATSAMILKSPAGQPWGVAVGTNYPDCGVYVYQFANNGQECPLIRYFRDHRSDVTHLTQSANGNVLATSSLDGTTKVWSLEGVFSEEPSSFSQARGWGMEVEAQPQGLFVKRVLAHSIAASRKIREGDVIEYAVGTNWDRITQGDQILQQLSSAPLYESHILKVNSWGEEAWLTPGWEPLVTIVIDQRKEWVAVSPTGQFQSSLLEGDRLFRWLISHGRDEAPSIIPGADLREQLENKSLLKNIFSNLAVALKSDLSVGDLQKFPVIRIVSPRLDEVYQAQQTIALRAEISQQTGGQVTWEAYSAHAPLGPPDEVGDTWAIWKYQPQGPLEDVFVRASSDQFNLTAAQFVRSEVQSAKSYQLHLVCAGVDPTHQLEYVGSDAAGMHEHFRTQRQQAFQVGYQNLLQNEGATTQAILESIDQAASQIRDRSDLFVLHLSGHGVVCDEGYCFVSHDWNEGQPSSEQLLTSGRLQQALRKINCRRMLILDTCDSYESVKGLAIAGKELRDQGVMIFSAVSGENTIARQNDQLKLSMFTGAILKGLRGPADGYANTGSQNNQITLAEIVRYVTDDVERTSGFEQRPGFAPSRFVESQRSENIDQRELLTIISEVSKASQQ